MAGMIDNCRLNRIETIFLDVAEDNRAARRIYEKCGFDCIDRRSKYFETDLGRIDALIFRLIVQ
jgi:ribosomal protein S18 acetylase RimI-like enzyme